MNEIVVICPDRPGAIASISSLLADRGINIDHIGTSGSAGRAAVSLAVDRYDEALQCLSEAGFDAFSEEAVVVRIEDKPGALARVSVRLRDAGINISSLRIVHRGRDASLAAIVTEDLPATRELFADILIQPGS